MKARWLLGSLLIAGFLIGCGEEDGVGSRPSGPAGRLYVLNQSDGTMYVYDTKTMARLDSIDTQVHNPHYIEFSADRQFFHITTLETTGHIARYNAATNALLRSVQAPASVMPSAIAITPDGAFGYVCNFTELGRRGRILKYDLSTLSTDEDYIAGATTHDVKMAADGSVVVACNRDTDDLTLIYPVSGPELDSVVIVPIDPDSLYEVGRRKYGPYGVAIDHKDSLAFIACVDADQLRVLDLARREIVDSVAIPVSGTGFVFGPTLLTVSPDDDLVYVTTQGGSSVVAVRISTMTVAANILFETPNSFGISISDDGSRVYVACVNTSGAQGRVYVIDGEKLVKVDSIDVGRQSFGLTWQPVP